jgi:hypothetical protein
VSGLLAPYRDRLRGLVDRLEATPADALEFDASRQSDLDRSRRVHEKSVVIEGRAKPNAMGLVRKRGRNGEHDVLRGRAGT